MKNVDSKQFADVGNNEKRWRLTVCRCIKSYDSVMQNMGVASPLKWRGFAVIIINREESWQRRQGSRSNHNSAFIFHRLTVMITSSDSSDGKRRPGSATLYGLLQGEGLNLIFNNGYFAVETSGERKKKNSFRKHHTCSKWKWIMFYKWWTSHHKVEFC